MTNAISMTVYKFELSTVSAIMNSLGITGALGPTSSSVLSAMCNGLNVCVQMLENAARTGVRVSPATAWARIVQVCGPFCGMSENAFIQLAGAGALLGISAVGLCIAFTAAAPVEIALAAIALFFDALGFAAVERGYRDAQRQVAINMAAKQRLMMILEQQYRRQQASVPRLGHPIPR